jgi:hypothetical protein
MPILKWSEYRDAIENIANGGWIVIGWGAGVGFNEFYKKAPIRLNYLVDNDNLKWGTVKNGFKIKSPKSIKNENPKKTIIIIYNYFDHGASIIKQLDEMGQYKALFNYDPYLINLFIDRLYKEIDQNEEIKKNKSKFKSSSAILVQGPYTSGITDLILKYYCSKYKNHSLILSTWADINDEDLAICNTFCDRVVINEMTEDNHHNSSRRNLNRQITSTRAGINAAKGMGIEKILKTRTDTLATADDLLLRSEALQSLYDKSFCSQYGLSNRIIVSERYTMRYIPYRISDIIMYGDLLDIEKYWSAPLDFTNPSKSINWLDLSFSELPKQLNSPEIYLASHYLNNINWNIKNTLEDYWDVLRKLFIVTDERWFGHFFPRYDLSSLDSNKGKFHGNSYVDFNYWVWLYSLLDLHDIESKNIKIENIKMRDIFNKNSSVKNYN